LSVHLVNPSDNSFGTAVITPRWLFVLAAATPRSAGDPTLVDESIEQIAQVSEHGVTATQRRRRIARKAGRKKPCRCRRESRFSAFRFW